MGLKPYTTFDQYPEATRDFFNCARTWAVQAGILHKAGLDSSDKQATSKHVTDITGFMNKMLGLNLNQQEIMFTCAVSAHCRAPRGRSWHRRARSMRSMPCH
jgi:hypothetical protein